MYFIFRLFYILNLYILYIHQNLKLHDFQILRLKFFLTFKYYFYFNYKIFEDLEINSCIYLFILYSIIKFVIYMRDANIYNYFLLISIQKFDAGF